MPRSPVERATRPDGRVDLKALDREALTAWMAPLGKAEHRARQVFKHAWQRGVTDFAEVDGIPKAIRTELAGRAVLSRLESAGVQRSSDGTRKYLWRLPDGEHIESVLIPDDTVPGRPRRTLCVSTQVGCAMKCSFCLTGDLGLKRNLTAAEIADQPLQVQADLPEGERITNLVMMGMGEPLHNYENLTGALRILLDPDGQNFSHRRITVSTVGLVDKLERFAQESPVNIAISLNATTEVSRTTVMPITRRHSLESLLAACRRLPLPSGKRITFEYVMMEGFNCSDADLARLAELMADQPAKVNLIPYNENPQRDIRRPSEARVKHWQHTLVSQGIHCSIRTTRGRDISAACGQLGKAADR